MTMSLGISRRGAVYGLMLLLMAAMAVFSVPCAAVGPDQTKLLRFLGNKAVPPFISLQDGKPVGIVVDLAYALAAKAGLSINVEAMDWSAAQSEVLHGKADALLQINPNPERERVYDFSDPVVESRFQIFREATRTDIQSLASLRGMKVGVESGGFPAQQLGGGGEFQLVLVPTWKAAFILLKAGQVDAVIVDRWVGEYELAVNRFEGITIVDPPVAESYSRIAVAKGNQGLLDKINLGLKAIRQDGTYQRVMDKWQPQNVLYFTRQFVNNLAFYASVVCGVIVVGISVLIFNARERKKLLATLERRVEERTRELEEHKASLEDTIDARTRELTRSNERLAAANEELESFSYSVSHDLRTPLRAIDGFSRILLEEQASGLGQEGLRLLDVILNSAAKMNQLIDDILAFSRMQRVELNRTDVDMEEIAQTAYNELESSRIGRCIEFRVGPLPRVPADAAMMRQAFVNLIGNAIKYSAPTPRALIEVEGHIQGGEAVYVIKDNGVGFDMKYAGRLFGVFQRLHGAAEFSGTGIGLSIVKRVIARHGGRVWADGKAGEGASFGFALPLQEVGDVPTQALGHDREERHIVHDAVER
jgi:signal transduction histidine kinase